MMKNKMKVALFLAATMMIGSANAYAASTTVPQTKIKPAAASSVKSEKLTSSLDDQIYELTKGLKPGQMVAYYAADKEYNPLDQIYFASKGFVYDTYSDYLKKAKAMDAPALTKPNVFPKGYVFQNAVLYLKSPEKTSDLYKKLEKELKAEAAKGNKTLYTQAIPDANEATAVVLNYEKGSVKLDVIANYIHPAPPMNGIPVPAEKPNEKTETIVINGVECVYTDDSKGRDHLDWVDEESQIRYTIWAESAKSDVLSFAKKMLAD